MKKSECIKYEEFFKLFQKYMNSIYQYVLKNNDMSDKYYVAKVFLNELSEKSYKNLIIREVFNSWLKNRSTLTLKKLLLHTGYDNSNLIHFNAFSLMDSVAAFN